MRTVVPYHNQRHYLFKRLPADRLPDACWEWQGTRYAGGYGQCWDVARQRNGGAHRIAYETLVGPIPEGMDILHTCDNPPCCNPAHLRPGSHRENMLDKIHKGRANVPRGMSAGQARLTDDEVRAIRARVASGETQAAVGAEHGVSQVSIHNIVKRKTWKHV